MISNLVWLVAVMMLGIGVIEGLPASSVKERGTGNTTATVKQGGDTLQQNPEEYLPATFQHCALPFKYKDDWYHGCTTIDKGRAWCDRNETYSEATWKWCDHNDYKPSGASGAAKFAEVETYSGKKCKFPFIHKGFWFYGCTTFDHPRHKSWCFTQNTDLGVVSQSTIQDLCIVEHNHKVSTFGGETNGEPCYFPYYYRGVKYHGCSNDDYSWTPGQAYRHRFAGSYTCAVHLTDDVAADDYPVTWGYCNVIDTAEHTNLLIETTGRAWKSTACVFPFNYNGKKKHGCIGTGSKPWCATTDNYDAHAQWKYCDDSDFISTADNMRDQKRVTRTNPQCSWPFVHDGILVNQDMWTTYYENQVATHFVFSRYCSSTHNYDKDQKQILSGRVRNLAGRCHFPFLYEGTLHHTCYSGQTYYWCLTDYGFTGDGNWAYCKNGRKLDSLIETPNPATDHADDDDDDLSDVWSLAEQ